MLWSSLLAIWISLLMPGRGGRRLLTCIPESEDNRRRERVLGTSRSPAGQYVLGRRQTSWHDTTGAVPART